MCRDVRAARKKERRVVPKQIQTTITARGCVSLGKKRGEEGEGDVRESKARESRYLIDLPEAMISWMMTFCGNVGELAPALRGTMMTVAL
jgi:hypothetical protein